MIYAILIGIFVIVAFLLVFVILIQSGKGGGLAGIAGHRIEFLARICQGRSRNPRQNRQGRSPVHRKPEK